MNPLEKVALEYIENTHLLAPGDRVGVAVSGGGDSVALLRILESLRDSLGVTLLVVHFDHSLRGAESEADARFVAQLARERGMELFLERADVAAVAARKKWNIEDAGRRLRYEFFERAVHEGRATRIAVAHNADDQAETVLAHLLRGTGPTGLAGIYPVVGNIVRPLLAHRRKELRDYLRELGQEWREDETNLDVRRSRARIREQLLPLIERDFSPLIVDRLGRLARLSREEEQFWNALVEDRFRVLVHAENETLSVRARDLLAPLDVPRGSLATLTKRLVRRLYHHVRGEPRGLTTERAEQVIHLASESTSGHTVELPGGVRVERSFDKLVFSRVKSKAAAADRYSAYCYRVELPAQGAATVSVPELKSRICLKVIDWSAGERDTKRGGEALDADLLRAPLILRNWRPGDAYRPRGHRQARKLKQMFLAERIPVGERANWPVLESAGRVVWARGMPPADECCAKDGTRAGVVIEEHRS